jgi:NADPH:quinone reductase-like Zn-dependent oxidoreductase
VHTVCGLKAGWGGVVVSRTFPLEQAALAHEYLETRRGAGRVVLIV